jgi:carboxypeptidase PM20D1
METPLSDHHGEAFELVRRTVDKTFPGYVTAPYVMTAASDSRYMDRVSDNCLRFTPFLIDEEQMESIHGLNENVNISTLAPAVDFYKNLIIEVNDAK